LWPTLGPGMPKDHHNNRKAPEFGHCRDEPQIRSGWTDGQIGRIPVAPCGPWARRRPLNRWDPATQEACQMRSLAVADIRRCLNLIATDSDRNPTQRYKDRKAFGVLGMHGFFVPPGCPRPPNAAFAMVPQGPDPTI